MTNASKDGNYTSTLIGVLNTDGTTITRVKVEPTFHSMKVDNNTTGSDNGPTPGRALKDGNYVSIGMGVSSVDGVTPVAIYVDTDGKLLIDSN